MKIKGYINKLFFEGTWVCAYRKLNENDKKQLTSDINRYEYKIISVQRRYWCADPFLITDNKKMYLFCEIMDRHKSKGMIGASEIVDGKISDVKLLKELNCHTSYPCIFFHNNAWYMIPETVGNKTIELYKAIKFPDNWILDTILLNEIEAVDTTVFKIGYEFYIFVYNPGNQTDNRILSIGKLNMDTKKIESFKELVNYNKKIGRPAGNVLNIKDKMIRPTQYSIKQYGEKIIYKEFSCLEHKYLETDCGCLSVKSIQLNKKYKICGIHTINRCGDYEIIDVYFNRFHPLRPIESILKKLKIGGYKFYELSERY